MHGAYLIVIRGLRIPKKLHNWVDFFRFFSFLFSSWDGYVWGRRSIDGIFASACIFRRGRCGKGVLYLFIYWFDMGMLIYDRTACVPTRDRSSSPSNRKFPSKDRYRMHNPFLTWLKCLLVISRRLHSIFGTKLTKRGCQGYVAQAIVWK